MKNNRQKRSIIFHVSARNYNQYQQGEKTYEWLKREYKERYNILLKNSEQIEGIRKCGLLVLELLDGVEQLIRPGLALAEINSFIHEKTPQ